MRVKAVQLASLFLLSLAVNTGAQAEQRSHFLVGAEAGVEARHTHYNFDYVLTSNAVAGTAGNLQRNQTRVVDTGSFLGLLTGWQIQCGRTLLGVEGSVDFHSFEETKQTLFADNVAVNAALTTPYLATAKYERGAAYQLSGRAGWWLTPFFMPYVRLGLQYSRDQITFTAPVRQIVSAANPGNPSFSQKTDVWSGVGGIGVEIPAFGPTSVRVEFDYIYSPSNSWSDTVGLMQGTHRVDHPKSYVGKASWVWNFA
tara:strand:- start:35252 stop:36019 length:768 start_codon:yes stop_codon:yes gene_type:complete